MKIEKNISILKFARIVLASAHLTTQKKSEGKEVKTVTGNYIIHTANIPSLCPVPQTCLIRGILYSCEKS